MKKKVIICLSILLLIVITVAILITNKSESTFYLDENYYGTNNTEEITFEELNKHIDNKESFGVLVYQPLCETSSDFEEVVSGFLEDNRVSIYKIAFSEFKDTKLGKSIKYYPSFIIYNGGKLVDYLEADKDEDVDYYTSIEGFEEWFTKYVKIKETTSSNSNISTNSTNSTPVEDENNNNIIEINLEDVVREDGKVNIYFFWGNGCPHCEKEFEFFESIKEQYGDHYNLYTFETWYNEENAALVNVFADSMGDKLSGVPYTIIGNKSFNGFKEERGKDFLVAIESQYQNSYDVYFDKIKSQEEDN